MYISIFNLSFRPEKVKPALVGDLTCNNYPSMLQGVSAAQKPFHGLPRMQQFDMMRKIMAMRTELSVKFESLRRAQMAIQRSKVIQDTIMRDGSGVPSSSGSYLPGTISTLYKRGRSLLCGLTLSPDWTGEVSSAAWSQKSAIVCTA